MMLKAQTKYYGEQEIDENEIVTFFSGLPGFKEEKQFIFQPFGEAFFILQSVKHAEVAFIVTSPFLFFDDYTIDLPDRFTEQLGIRSENEAAVWVIVSIRRPFVESTVNLRAPIVINTRKNIGKQYIPDESPYGLQEPLMSRKKDVN